MDHTTNNSNSNNISIKGKPAIVTAIWLEPRPDGNVLVEMYGKPGNLPLLTIRTIDYQQVVAATPEHIRAAVVNFFTRMTNEMLSELGLPPV